MTGLVNAAPSSAGREAYPRAGRGFAVSRVGITMPSKGSSSPREKEPLDETLDIADSDVAVLYKSNGAKLLRDVGKPVRIC